LREKDKLFSNTDCFEIIIQLLTIFEIVHSSFRTYNDLKLANIMVSNTRHGPLQATLIDYGFSNFFIDKKGEHIAQGTTVDTF